MKTTFKRIVSFMLSTLMVFSVCSTALVVYANDARSGMASVSQDSVINYVSIGDSMTNGYGLDGYDAEAGVYDYGYASYANQFAAALAGYTTEEFYAAMATAQQGFGVTFTKNGTTVNHSQLGLSAARPEDIAFLLNLDYDDPAVVALLDKYPTDDKVYWNCGNHSGVNYDDIVYCAHCKWDHIDLPGYGVWDGNHSVDDYPAWWTLVHGENWENLIGYGDFWTWKELAEDYRFGTVATYIKSIYGTAAEKARAAELMANRPAKPRDDASNGVETCYVAKHYQEQIANADVVSLGIGNGNFGVWLMGRITTALMDYDGIGYNYAYQLNDALKHLSPDLANIANDILVELDPYIEQLVATMMGKVDEAKQKSIKDVCTYAVVSFMVNYKNMIERILELNPDVEIVMLGLMNTYAGDDAMATEGQVTIGNILDIMFPPLNAYIAAVPTLLNSELTKYANFYYAEEYSIECLIQNFGDDAFYKWEGVARDRFVTGVVGECDCGRNCSVAESCGDWDYGIFWELLDGFDMGGVEVQRINQSNIKLYESLDSVGKVQFAAANKDMAGSIAVYLAIEDAICKSGRLAPVTLATLTGLKLGDPAILEKALSNFAAEQEKIIADYYADAIAGLNALGVTEPTQTQINDMSMILSLPVALSNALWTDTALCSMLAVVARNKLGNGLGAHPSVNGHAALAEEMIKAYFEGYTPEDKIIDNIFYLITEYYDEAYMMVDSLAVKNADYMITKNSSYVVFGDNAATATGFASYLTSEIGGKYGIAYNTDTSYAIDGSRISTLAAILAMNPAVIASADLISIDYSLNKTTEDTLNILFDLLANGESALLATPLDWNSLVGPEVAAEIQNYLSQVKTMLDEQGMNVKIAEMNSFFATFKNGLTISEAAAKAVEYFAYYAIEYIALLPNVVSAIRQINPDALIMVNAVSNPVANAGVVFGEMQLMFGEYFDVLVDLVYLSTAALSLTYENVVLVPTTQAKTTFTNKLLGGGTGFEGLLEILNYMLDNTQVSITPTEDGNAYILATMKSALNIVVKRGDFNLDGKVTVADTVYLMQHLSNPAKVALNQSGDVNGDGAVNSADVTYLLRHILSPAKYALK